MDRKFKVGILTIIDNKNYGNRLQNFALQEAIKKLGYEVVTIKNIPYSDWKYKYDLGGIKEKIKFIIKVFINFKKKNMQKAIENYNNQFNLNDKRLENFNNFNKKIIFSKEWLTIYNFKEFDEKCDCYVVGSDQVWNYRYGRANGIDFLDFSKKAKRISYAASLGVDSIPNKYKKRYINYLKKMDCISVRELSAVKILEKLCDKQISNVVDPTMLIKPAEWQKIADNVDVELPSEYIVTLYLGDSDKKEKIIHDFANENRYKIIKLNNPTVEKYFEFGTAEFLKVILNAKFVFTDSFHTCVFSILFHKDFYAIERIGDDETIFSRIDDLLKMFQLEERILSDNTVISSIDENVYARVDNILEIKRQKGFNYLKSSLNIFWYKDKLEYYKKHLITDRVWYNAINLLSNYFLYVSINDLRSLGLKSSF